MKYGNDVHCEEACETAKSLFESGFYCAESVLMALANKNSKATDNLSCLMSGMCGGLSRSGGTCGALVGAVAAFGLLFGRNNANDSKQTIYTISYNMAERFKQEFGSTLCSGVLGCDISTIEGAKIFEEKDLDATRCLEVTTKTTIMAQKLILNYEKLVHPLL